MDNVSVEWDYALLHYSFILSTNYFKSIYNVTSSTDAHPANKCFLTGGQALF